MALRKTLLPLLLLVIALVGCSSTGSTVATGPEAPADTSQAPTSDASSEDASSENASAEGAPSEDASDDAADAPAQDEVGDPPARLVPNEAPRGWFNESGDGASAGMATDELYRTVLEGREPKRTVTVAIIDSGVDIEHEDLQDVIWVNEDEVPGNGTDDDGNGYVDDVHGWNFIGGPDGENVEFDTLELTRIYVRLHEKYAGVDSTTVAPDNRDEYRRYQKIKAEFQNKKTEAQERYRQVQPAYDAVQMSTDLLKDHLGTDTLTESKVRSMSTNDGRILQAQNVLTYFYDQGMAPNDVVDYYEYLDRQVNYNYNADFNPRPIVQDDYDDKTERIYGNNDVIGPNADHGTHVAGIVAAVRDNGVGMDGVATGVRIMSVRTVPEGDERDKDVANAIRYAVDNGADVVNMSFGKGYSPHKDVVDDAVRYAMENDVLLIHAAGNSGANIDSTDNFPTRFYEDGGEADLWIEVGAASWEGGDALAATFSNYGASSVHVFAPGTAIYSTVPGSAYKRNDGTSMAAPMVTGLAALLMAYHPELSAAEVRSVILDSARRYADVEVTRPGGEAMVPFGQLSITGAVVNALAAFQRVQTSAP